MVVNRARGSAVLEDKAREGGLVFYATAAKMVQKMNATEAGRPTSRSNQTQPIEEGEMAKVHRICSFQGCGKALVARGLCRPHYDRLMAYGDPSAGRIPNGEATRFLNDVVLPCEHDDCLIWPYAKNRGGYGAVAVEGKKWEVHRFVCIQRHGPPPSDKHCACHNCGNGHLGCCNPNHLRWDTQKGNFADKVRHGTYTRGEAHSAAKLSQCQIEQIRLLAGEMPQAAIARQFGVASSTISAIVHRKVWGWLT